MSVHIRAIITYYLKQQGRKLIKNVFADFSYDSLQLVYFNKMFTALITN